MRQIKRYHGKRRFQVTPFPIAASAAMAVPATTSISGWRSASPATGYAGFQYRCHRAQYDNTHRASGNGCAKTLDHLLTPPALSGPGINSTFSGLPCALAQDIALVDSPSETRAHQRGFHVGSINSIYQFDHRQICYLFCRSGNDVVLLPSKMASAPPVYTGRFVLAG